MPDCELTALAEGGYERGSQAVAGRGLQIVHELSRGRWGHHPTRARLGGWGVRGKAVWFAVPAPLAHARLMDVTGLHAYTLSADVTATRANERLSARQAATGSPASRVATKSPVFCNWLVRATSCQVLLNRLRRSSSAIRASTYHGAGIVEASESGARSL